MAKPVTNAKPLAPPDNHHLKAAEGWIELGNHLEANEELDNMTAALRAHPDVLELRWQIYAKAGKWEACVDIGAALVAAAPNTPGGWIHRSYALHELKRTDEALELLEPAASKFKDVWTIPYNLACYACQLGNQDEAWEWLEDAIDLDYLTNHRRHLLWALAVPLSRFTSRVGGGPAFCVKHRLAYAPIQQATRLQNSPTGMSLSTQNCWHGDLQLER